MTQIKSLVDAIDSFIKGTKADGDWDAIKASCIMAGWDGLAGCLTPLKGTAPTNVGPFVTGDYNRITGLKGNGSTKYLDSNYLNSADSRRNNNHQSVFGSEYGDGVFFLGDNFGASGHCALSTGGTGHPTTRNMQASATTAVSTPIETQKLFGSARSSSASYLARANSTNYTIEVASQDPAATSIGIFRLKETSDFASSARLTFYSIGESLNLANLDTRVSTLMTAIGAALA